MTLSSLRLALLAGLALPLGLATASLAQDAQPAPPPGAAGASHEHHWDPARMRAHMAERLSAALQLQPGQQAALAAYLDSMKPPGDHANGMMDGGPGEASNLSTPERLDRMMARFDQMHARMAAHVQATKQFYAQLTPSQQKAFDTMAPTMMHHLGGHHGMMGSHGGGDEPGHEMGPGGQPPG